MSERLQVTFQDLADKGITPNDLTADEICLLVHACERVDSPYSSLRADLLEKPIRVIGDVFFWKPTAGAIVWLTEYASRWWGDNSWMGKWATIYALANAREKGAFTDERDVMRARVLKCALRLCVHSGELWNAINACYGLDEYDAQPLSKKRTLEKENRERLYTKHFASIVARLEVTSGIKQDDWLWGRSIESLTHSYIAQAELAAAAFVGRKNEANEELDRAIENLALVVAHITRRINQEREHLTRAQMIEEGEA